MELGLSCTNPLISWCFSHTMLSTNAYVQESFQHSDIDSFRHIIFVLPSTLKSSDMNPVHQHSQLTLIYLPQSPINKPQGLEEKTLSLTQHLLNCFNSALFRRVFGLMLIKQGNPVSNVPSSETSLLILSCWLKICFHCNYISIPKEKLVIYYTVFVPNLFDIYSCFNIWKKFCKGY